MLFFSFLLLGPFFAVAAEAAPDRLPVGLKIYKYNLHLNFTEDTFTVAPYQYTGYLEIQFTLSPSYPSNIKLHASSDYIVIDSASLQVNVTVTDLGSIETDIENELIVLGDTERAKETAYYCYLFINYTSRLSVEDMYGLYRVGSTDSEKFSLASQFEPTFARRILPCQDEPTFKTNFRLNVTYPAQMEVYFNTPEDTSVNSTDDPDDDIFKTVYFKTTGVMAPYMFGLMVVNPEEFTCSLGSNFTYSTIYYFRVCSRPDLEYARQWALDIGPTIMDFIYNITNYGYGVIMGFQKLDLMALPDLVTGASENWGIITYREERLLFDEEHSSNLDKQLIARTLTYEFVQMWYGNFVTAEWWHYCYFTKGLAHYLSFLVTNEIFEEWELSSQFITDVLQPTLDMDSWSNSTGLRSGANTTVEIISKLSEKAIMKGACIARMLNEVIAGYASFRLGLEYFVTSYSARTTEPQGLWNLIRAQVNLDNRDLLPPDYDLRDALLIFETTGGFPLVNVSRQGANFTVGQMGRFSYSGPDPTYQWYIPVSYVTSSNLTGFSNTTLSRYVVPYGSFDVVLPTEDEEWIVLNTRGAGYYRVHYGNVWPNISVALRRDGFSGIPDTSRALLLDDAFALARAGLLNYSFVLDMASFLAEDESLYAWTSGFKSFKFLVGRVGSASSLGMALESLLFGYSGKIYSKVPWTTVNEDDQIYSLTQMEVLKQLCSFGYTSCVKSALSEFANFKASGKRPHNNLRRIVYCAGLKYGSDTSHWDVLWKAYQETDSRIEKLNILWALGCTENEVLLWKSLELTLTETSEIKPHDAPLVFKSVLSNGEHGIDVALDFLINNHEKIAKRYQEMNNLAESVLELANLLTTDSQVEKFRLFLSNKANLAEELALIAAQAVEIAEVNAAWSKLHVEELNQYFNLTQST